MPDDDAMYWLARAAAARPAWELPVEEVDPWRSLNIVGESYTNSDGSSRQFVIGMTYPGDEITLVPEPDNSYDENAVAVFTRIGQIGYLSRQHSEWIADKIASGHKLSCRLERITGGTDDKPNLGAVLALRLTA